ncbi:hypothetical protein GCM10009821_27990 [Aeromicrobium halocynthiae]|uniref:Bacterial transcriptional activator domain-containing protein n=1 Tax=Aeromicrobium halocynthiae TaxID=560557 RepID=A0ABN2W7C6_9ACTN
MSITTGPGSTSRLPTVTKVPRRGAEVAKGLAALVGTIVIVVGVPVALLAGFGAPWPSEAPSLEWLTRPTTMEATLSILAAVVWLAWAHFVVCLLVEAVAERRRRGLAPQVPGGGIGTQALARRLVATIVLMAGTASVSMSTATAATAPAAEQSSYSASVLPEAAAFGETPTEQQVGVGSATLPELADLQDATTADVEAGATTYYDVKPPEGRHYDTLWDIADRYLGDGLRYKEIWELNKGVEQPDGRVLANADLIHPGWVMKMPSDARGPGLKVVEHVAPAPDVDPTAATAEAGTADTAGDVGAGESTPAGAGGGAGQAGGGSIIGERWQPFFGVGAGLALAGAFLGLRRHRATSSAASRWSRRGERPDPTDPTPTPPPPGGRLREEADVDAVTWLDNAFRSWNDGHDVPAPARASYSESGLVVGFEQAPTRPVPAGWSAPRPTTWTADTGTDFTLGGPAPLPGLVTLGRRDDGSLLMVDLESQSGPVAVDGDASVARGIALSWALDAATHPWADDRRVTLVGFADDLSRVAPGVVRRTDDVGRVLESLENLARLHRRRCRETGREDVRSARAASPDADWTFHLVVCSGLPREDEMAQLRALAADPAVSLGVVVVGSDREAALSLHARADGRISAPHHGIDVTAQVLTRDAARALDVLFEPVEAGRRPSLETLVDALESEGEVSQAAAEAVATVDVLGPLRIGTQGQVDPEREPQLSELLVLLALHPQGVHVNRLTAALWPRGVEPSLRDGVIAQLGDWLGSTTDGEPVLRESSGVWTLAPGAVRLDWDAFREHLNRAATDGRQRETHLRTALELVRGTAFDGAPAGRYAWLESTTVESDIALAIELTVQALAEAATSRADLAAAEAALRRGLELLPANEELWRSRLWLAESEGSDVEGIVDAMYAAIAEHGSPVGASAATDALVDELVPGYRSSVA